MALPTRVPRKPSDLTGQPNGNLSSSLLRLIPVGGQMHHLAARAFVAMRAHADAAGYNLDYTARTSGGAYRTYDRQVQMLKERAVRGVPQGGSWSRYWPQDPQGAATWYGRPGTAMVATPGNSNHGWGLAIDLALDPDETPGGPVRTIDPAVPWLVSNGPRFGFWHESQSEPWHMSYGDGNTLPSAVIAFENGGARDLYAQEIDISFHNLGVSSYSGIPAAAARVDYGAPARRGCDGVIIRAGNANRTPSAPPWDSSRMIDGSAELFVAGYRKAGMFNLTLYWWVSPTVPAKTQAAKLAELWRRVGGVPGGVMLDVEDSNRATPLTWKNTLDGLIRELKTLGVPVKRIYTGSWWWDSTLAGFHDDWAHLDLMEAEYPRNNDKPPSATELWDDWAFAAASKGPSASKGWLTWSGWQFTSSADGSDFGFPNNDRLDGNVIKQAAFDRWYGVTVPEIPHPPVLGPPYEELPSMLFKSTTRPEIWLAFNGVIAHVATAADNDLAELRAKFGHEVPLLDANVAKIFNAHGLTYPPA